MGHVRQPVCNGGRPYTIEAIHRQQWQWAVGLGLPFFVALYHAYQIVQCTVVNDDTENCSSVRFVEQYVPARVITELQGLFHCYASVWRTLDLTLAAACIQRTDAVDVAPPCTGPLLSL